MLNGMTYNELAYECHGNNAKWWHDLVTGERLDRNVGELILLMISEIVEAMEGERKNLMDDKLPHRKMAEVELADAVIRIGDFAGGFGLDIDAVAVEHGEIPEDIKSTYPENKSDFLLLIVRALVEAREVADIGLHRSVEWLYGALKIIELYAEVHGYDLAGAYTEKTAYNKVRADHKADARLAEGGKKF